MPGRKKFFRFFGSDVPNNKRKYGYVAVSRRKERAMELIAGTALAVLTCVFMTAVGTWLVNAENR
ncbi:MAG: hypothetical protein OHK0029_08400 [Armatimonadaceae bacterium]